MWEVGRESVEWRERVAQRDLQRERERAARREGVSPKVVTPIMIIYAIFNAI